MGSVQVGLKLSWQESEFPSMDLTFSVQILLGKSDLVRDLRKVESSEITVKNEKVK